MYSRSRITFSVFMSLILSIAPCFSGTMSYISDFFSYIGRSNQPSISADGRYVAYCSSIPDIVPGINNTYQDIYVFDRQLRHTTCISLSSDGTEGNSFSGSPYISADGRYVAFDSNASNLISNDTNNCTDIFVYDMLLHHISRISISGAGLQGNSNSTMPVISADGRYIAFESSANNLVPSDTNNMGDLFVFDRETSIIKRITTGINGGQVSNFSRVRDISADGRYIVFESFATNLVVGDTNGKSDVFLYDQHTDKISRLSINNNLVQGNGESERPCISADGRYVAFMSDATNLVPDDTNDVDDIFLYDCVTSKISRITMGVNGLQSNKGSGSPTISADGNYITFFSGATNLVTGDTNNQDDIFVYDHQAKQTLRINVKQDGTQMNNTSSEPHISKNGQSIAFSSFVPYASYNSWNVLVYDAYQGRPDIQIKGPDDLTFIGKNIYNYAPTQTSYSSTYATTHYNIMLDTDSELSTRYHLVGNAGTNGWTIRYYNERDNREITGDITTKGFDVFVAPSMPIYLRVDVSATSTVVGNSICDATINAHQVDDINKSDYVIARTAKTPLHSIKLNVSPASPIPIGNTLTLTAIPTGGGACEYEFKAKYTNDTAVVWVPIHGFSSEATCTWKPSLATAYTLYVTAREIGSTKCVYSPGLLFTVNNPLTAVALTISPSGPKAIGSTLTLRAIPSGGTKVEYDFKAKYTDPIEGTIWIPIQNFTLNGSGILWTPPQARTYTIYASAREHGTINTIYAPSINFTITPVLSNVSLQIIAQWPRVIGQQVTLKANVAGGAKIEYEFKAKYSEGGATIWVPIQTFTPNRSQCNWKPLDTHMYSVYVTAREQGTTSNLWKYSSQNLYIAP